jgi:hypothetical protein
MNKTMKKEKFNVGPEQYNICGAMHHNAVANP